MASNLLRLYLSVPRTFHSTPLVACQYPQTNKFCLSLDKPFLHFLLCGPFYSSPYKVHLAVLLSAQESPSPSSSSSCPAQDSFDVFPAGGGHSLLVEKGRGKRNGR